MHTDTPALIKTETSPHSCPQRYRKPGPRHSTSLHHVLLGQASPAFKRSCPAHPTIQLPSAASRPFSSARSRCHTRILNKFQTSPASRSVPNGSTTRSLRCQAASETPPESNNRTDNTPPIPFVNWTLTPGVIDPNAPWYRVWWSITIAAAAFTGFFIPWSISFGDVDSLYEFPNWTAVVNAALTLLFASDIIVNFKLAYTVNDVLVDDKEEIARTYRAHRLWLDLLGVIPLEPLALAAGHWMHLDQSYTVHTFELFNLVQLVRLYRVRWFFRYLEYDLTISLLWVTMARNLTIVLYVTHLVACGFEFVGRQEGFSPNVLVGTNPELYRSLSAIEQYVYALYWSVTTLAGNEWNGMDTVTNMEQVVASTMRAAVFFIFNIALSAYILGTITLLLVKSDERTGQYRDLSANLKQYSLINKLPPELKDTMQEHLKLSFNYREASDEQVLSIYPTTIRRKILRYLYIRYLREAYLFHGCSRKFLDALLSVARLELFMPDVEILAAGDNVNELFLVVQGQVEIRSPLDETQSFFDDTVSPPALSELQEDEFVDSTMDLGNGKFPSSAWANSLSSVGHKCAVLGEGQLFGEIAFFTEIPQLESVRSLTPCRVMVIPRSAYESLERNFPLASRLVLENLQQRSEEIVQAEFPSLMSPDEVLNSLEKFPSSLMYSWVSPELVEMINRSINPGGRGFTARQELVVSNLLRVHTAIRQHIAKQDEDRTTEFLYAASRGDCSKARALLQQGFNVNSMDYDNRTALMLAAAKGHVDMVGLLLSAGANPHLQDSLGRSAMLEACFHGHDLVIQQLLEAGTSVGGQGRDVSTAALMCECVYTGNLPLLRRLLTAGAPVDAGDYDQRTALHISAAECSISAVRLLVEEGGANLLAEDRWGKTALDEALRVGCAPVAAYLTEQLKKQRLVNPVSSSNGHDPPSNGHDPSANGRAPPSTCSVCNERITAQTSQQPPSRETCDDRNTRDQNGKVQNGNGNGKSNGTGMRSTITSPGQNGTLSEAVPAQSITMLSGSNAANSSNGVLPAADVRVNASGAYGTLGYIGSGGGGGTIRNGGGNHALNMRGIMIANQARAVRRPGSTNGGVASGPAPPPPRSQQ